MKARLLFMDNSYHLLLCNATVKKLTAAEALDFLRTFDSDFHYAGKNRWDMLVGYSMDDYGGLTVARVTDEKCLEIVSADHFRELLLAKDTKYLSPKEFAEMHGKQRTIVTNLCRQNRIPGVIRRGKNWLIPEDAPYPEDLRTIVHSDAHKNI